MQTHKDGATGHQKQKRDRARKMEQREAASANGFRRYTLWLGPDQKAATIQFIQEVFGVDPRSPKAVVNGSTKFDPQRFERLLVAIRGAKEQEKPETRTTRKKPKASDPAPGAELALEYGSDIAADAGPDEIAKRNETDGKRQAAGS
jgi:hypothetical protein